jgi:hypothetical protein
MFSILRIIKKTYFSLPALSFSYWNQVVQYTSECILDAWSFFLSEKGIQIILEMYKFEYILYDHRNDNKTKRNSIFIQNSAI